MWICYVRRWCWCDIGRLTARMGLAIADGMYGAHRQGRLAGSSAPVWS